MPLVRVSLMKPKPQEFLRKMDDIVCRSVTDTLYVPGKDAMQVVTAYSGEHLTYGSSDSGSRNDAVVIEITLTEGRPAELKNKLFRTLVERLKTELNVRPDEVFMNLVETKQENWAWRNK